MKAAGCAEALAQLRGRAKEIREVGSWFRIGESVALREFLDLVPRFRSRISEGLGFGAGRLAFQPFVSRFKFLEADNQNMFHAQAPGIEIRTAGRRRPRSCKKFLEPLCASGDSI